MVAAPVAGEAWALLHGEGGTARLYQGLHACHELVADAATVRPGAFSGAFARFCAQVEEAQAQAEAAGVGGYPVVALHYELGAYLQDLAPPPDTSSPVSPPRILARCWCFSHRQPLSAPAVSAWLAAQAARAPAALADLQPGWNAREHAERVARIKAYIEAGDCYQINLTFPFSATLVGDAVALYARLRAAQPVDCGALILPGDGSAILSFSPELFLSRQAGRVTARPMKGTAPRGGTPADDELQAARLGASVKDRAENLMIVDLLRNDLGRIADVGSVAVPRLFDVEAYPSLYQLTSTITARSGAGLASLLNALFPCGSITGAPKRRAMEIIQELETAPRQLYTGAIGCWEKGGDFRFNVAIRTLSVQPDGRCDYGVGSGIVWDSEAGAEWQECLLKTRFLQSADPGFRLIETLRLEEGGYPYRAEHRERVSRAAAELGFLLPGESPAALAARFDALLAELAKTRRAGCWRVRVSLGKPGDLTGEVQGELLPLTGSQGLLLVPRPLDDAERTLRGYKTTARARYDQDLAALTRLGSLRDAQGAPYTPFDLCYFNGQGEVVEGARSNVFVLPPGGGPLLTPPRSAGCLPGVLRAHLLAAGRAREARLTRLDLAEAASVFCGNGLRGLIPVRPLALPEGFAPA